MVNKNMTNKNAVILSFFVGDGVFDSREAVATQKYFSSKNGALEYLDTYLIDKIKNEYLSKFVSYCDKHPYLHEGSSHQQIAYYIEYQSDRNVTDTFKQFAEENNITFYFSTTEIEHVTFIEAAKGATAIEVHNLASDKKIIDYFKINPIKNNATYFGGDFIELKNNGLTVSYGAALKAFWIKEDSCWCVDFGVGFEMMVKLY